MTTTVRRTACNLCEAICGVLVTVDDAAEADRTFDMLMGEAVDPRRRFIQTHAKSVKNLDI